MHSKLLLGALLATPALTLPTSSSTSTTPTSPTPAAGLLSPPSLFDDPLLPPPAETTTSPREDPAAVVDEYLFALPLASFSSRRAARRPPGLDWSSDECSTAPDNPLGFRFAPACERHDFGYRNYKKQGRFTGDAKDRIDTNFKKE